MQRAHWRLGLWVDDAQRPAVLHALAKEPACVRWDRVLGDAEGQPTLWADFMGRDAHALTHSVQRTLRGLPMQRDPITWTLQRTPPPCDCADHDGPCTDLALAQAVEAGLPLVAQPHRHHRGGRLYSVRIDLIVPGGEIVVNRDQHLDLRRADAFERARVIALAIDQQAQLVAIAPDAAHS